MLTQPGIRRFVVAPLLVNIVVFSAGLFFAVSWFDLFMKDALDTSDMWRWVAAIVEFFKPLLWLIFAVTLGIVIFYTFTIIANLIAAPFNGVLSEAVERHLSGDQPVSTLSLSGFLKEIGPALSMELRKLIYLFLWSIPFLLLLFTVPVVGPLLWMLFSAWMLSLQYMDYPMSNHRLSFKRQRRLQREKRLLAMGFGGTVMVATMIPFVNFVAMPTAVVAATLLWREQYRASPLPECEQ